MVSNFFLNYFYNFSVYETLWKKYCITGQVRDDNMAHAYCMLDT